MQHQMANAARTMGLSGMQNLNNGDGKMNVQHGGNNQMKMETENSPANNQNNQVSFSCKNFAAF